MRGSDFFDTASRSPGGLNLDLQAPVRLDLWAVTVAIGIASGTVAPAFALFLVAAGVVVCVGAVFSSELVPPEWRLMALLSPIFLACGVALAFTHASAEDPLADLAAIEPGEVSVSGVVVSPPVPTKAGGYRADVRVESLSYEGMETLRGGRVEVYSGDLAAGVGDGVQFTGEISSPEQGEDGFDYGRYLATRRVSAMIYAGSVQPSDGKRGWVGRLQRQTDVALGYGLRPVEAAVVRGMLFGDDSRIPEELEEAYRRSGIAHVLAISGQHVAVLTAAVYLLLRLFAVPLVMRNLSTIGLVWLYIFIAGAPPSGVRAGVVATLVLLAPLLGRQLSPLHFMTAMLALVLAWNPMLVYSGGFQLSVAAVFGILLLRKPFLAFLRSTVLRPLKKPPRAVEELLAISLAAQVATTPILAVSFEEVSLVGVAANLIAVPLSGPILVLGMLGAMAGGVVPALAYPINAVNGFFVMLLNWIAHGASSLPFAAVGTSGASLPLVALFYAGCVPAAVVGLRQPEEQWSRPAGLLLAWAAAWVGLVAVL